MAGEGYELLALFMRYVFVALGALILWRAFRWMRRDARDYHKQMKRLPDAGLIGEIVNLSTGKSQPLPREGMMGSAAFCDVRVKGKNVRRRHALFSLAEGRGVLITPCRGRRVVMEDVELTGPAYALHGTELWLGDVPLRVRLFAGLNVPHPAAYTDEPGEDEAFAEELSEYAQGYAAPLPNDAWQEEQADPLNAYDANQTAQPDWIQPEDEFPAPEAEPENEEAMPYQSPLPRRRRRERHE